MEMAQLDWVERPSVATDESAKKFDSLPFRLTQGRRPVILPEVDGPLGWWR
jgi:hypothetical protein